MNEGGGGGGGGGEEVGERTRITVAPSAVAVKKVVASFSSDVGGVIHVDGKIELVYTWRDWFPHLKNLLVLTIAFLCFFIAFGSLQNLVSSVFPNGANALASIYLVFIFSSLLVCTYSSHHIASQRS